VVLSVHAQWATLDVFKAVHASCMDMDPTYSCKLQWHICSAVVLYLVARFSCMNSPHQCCQTIQSTNATFFSKTDQP
jgi:hypothetical protein